MIDDVLQKLDWKWVRYYILHYCRCALFIFLIALLTDSSMIPFVSGVAAGVLYILIFGIAEYKEE